MTRSSVLNSRQPRPAQRLQAQMSPQVSWSSSTDFVVPSRRSDVDEHVVDEEGILLDPTTARTLQLNRTALAVWRRCNGKATTVEIAQSQSEVFDVDIETALDDVEQLIAMFAEAGLLESGVAS